MENVNHPEIYSLAVHAERFNEVMRTTLERLREGFAELAGGCEEHVVFDWRHEEPAIAFDVGEHTVLLLEPESGTGVLQCMVPLDVHEEELLELGGLPGRVCEAVRQAPLEAETLWVELSVHSLAQADEVIELLRRRIKLLMSIWTM